MKNKKILFSIIVLACAFVFLSGSVNAASVTTITSGTEGDYDYTVYLENGKYWAELTKYYGSSSNPAIPTAVESKYTVTKIGNSLFKDNTTITKITIPGSITVIGQEAFANCSNLESVTFPNMLTKVGGNSVAERYGAFYNCDKLTNIIIPKSITYAPHMFAGCDNLAKVTIESGMTTLPASIFASTTNPNMVVTLPDTITTIGEYAFDNSKITSIVLPNSITTIKSAAFRNCQGITSITLPKNLQTLSTSNSEAFGSFRNCDSLTEIIIPKTVTKAPYTFANCDNLEKITIESGMTRIPDKMFAYMNNINVKISIPDTVTIIGSAAFENSNMLNDQLTENITKIESYAYQNCSNLTVLDLPDSILTIESSAFRYCKGLTSVTLPKNLQTLSTASTDGFGSFTDCDLLREIIIPKTVTKASFAFSNCDNLAKVTIESGMTTLPKSIFANTTNPDMQVVLPNTIKTIGVAAFENSNMLSVTIPESVTKIENYAFRGATNMLNIKIPALVSSLGYYVFDKLTKDQTINFDYKEAYSGWNKNWAGGCNAVIKYGTRGTPFTDVDLTDWYFLSTEYCYKNRIISGTSSTKFSPSNKVTRGMMVTMLYSMAGAPAVSGTNKFSDVSSSKYYYKAILWASQNNIVKGYTGTTKFGPNDYVTREQLAVMLTSFAMYNKKYTASNYGLTKFTDSSSVSSWALPAMRWAVKNKIISGSNGKLNPKGTATRAEAATMIYSYFTNVN